MLTSQDERCVNATDEAVYWVVLLHTCEDVSDVLSEYLHWLNADPRNYREYMAFQRVWRDLAELNDSGLLDLAWSRAATEQRLPARQLRKPAKARSKWRRALPILVAVSVSIAVGVAIKGYWPTHPAGELASCDTCGLASGQHGSNYGTTKSLDLTDGSEITLGANSQVTLDIAADRRVVQLDRGEALFRVSKGRAVPFEVHVGSMIFRAAGTLFSVERIASNNAETVVQEGGVLVMPNSYSTYRVNARQTGQVKDGEFHLRSTAQSKVDTRQLWTAGMLSLDGESLNEAAQRLNRYNRDQLEVDPALADEPVWGAFPALNPGAFAEALDQMLDIRHFVTQDPASGVATIHLTPKKR